MADAVRVTGLVETRRALRSLSNAEQLPEVREGLRAAAQAAAANAQGRVPSASGAAAGSIRAVADGTTAAIAGGGGVPYYAWLDFGTRKPRKGNPRSRGPWSGSGVGPRGGRFIYPALKANKAETAEAVAKGLDQAIRKAGWH